MASEFADYMSGSYTAAVRITRCRSYIAYLTALSDGPTNLNSDSHSVSYDRLGQLAAANANLIRLESDPRAMNNGGVSRGVFGRF